MVKKILIAAILIFLAYGSNAQNKYVDSLKNVLAHASIPIERFSLLEKIQEYLIVSGTGNVDSFTCIQLLKIARQLNNDSLLASSYNWIGDYFLSDKGDVTTALEYLFKGMPLAEKVKDRRRISSLYLDISVVYFNLNNPVEAVKYIRKAGANLPFPKSPMYDYMARQYQATMANYYILQRQPDSALHFVQELNETNLRLKSVVFESYAQVLSGEVYEQSGDKTLAEFYYQQANALADSGRYYDTKLFIKKKYTLFLLRNNKTKEAKEQALKLLELGKQINNNNMKLAGAGFLRQVYAKQHLADSAYHYSRIESSLKDSIFSQNNTNKIQALAFNEELRSMDEEAKNAIEAEHRKENIQYALIALAIITFIVLFLLISRSMITNTKVIEFLGVLALLIVFEFLELLLHPFLKNVTNNTPLLMLLALVGIASLLIPMHNKLEQWATKRLVEKNIRIRLANAKKTIRLLSDEQSEREQ